MNELFSMKKEQFREKEVKKYDNKLINKFML